jgi:hypothetical protein
LETLVEVEDELVVRDAERWIEEHLARGQIVTRAMCAAMTLRRRLADWLGLLAAELAQLLGRLLRVRR